ncbi:MAG: oligoendopeptidase F [Paraclostridium sp.]
MGKNIYRVISIVIICIICSTIALKNDIESIFNNPSESTVLTLKEKDKEDNKDNQKENQEVKKAVNDSWNLTNLYNDKTEWKKDLKKFSKDIKELENYIGKITKSPTHMSYALKIKEDLDKKVEKLYAYVLLNRDINKKSYDFINLKEDLNKVYREYNSICSNIELEILKLTDKEFNKIIKGKNIDQKYGMYLKDIRRNKKYYLDSEKEELLGKIGDLSSLPREVYELFTKMDKSSIMNPSEYATSLESPNRDERKKAFESEFVTYNDNINMLSGLLIGQVKKNVFYSQTRGYENSRQMYMLSDDIDTKVYDSLVNTVNKNLSGLHKYVKLRKEVLNLDKVHSYDMYTPIVEPVNDYISYDKAQSLIYSSLNPLGKEYGDVLYKAFNERWIDVYSKDEKVGGAYCLSVYNNHPYVLLNYSGSLDSVSTLAHELGHAVYSHMSVKNQNYTNANPSIFNHEVASITNEALLYEMLIKNSTDDNQKAYYITQYLDLIKGTLFIQTMYAEFENTIHTKVESGESINVLVLNDIWGELLQKYYGKEYELDQLSKVGWSRIPHFYNSFYVYKYATGCSAAIAFSQDIIKNGSENYLQFLKKGSSKYPMELLKESGINLNSTKPIEETGKKFNSLVDELEKIIIK